MRPVPFAGHPGHRRPAQQRRRRPGDATDDDVLRRRPLEEAGVDDGIADQRGERQQRGDRVDPEHQHRHRRDPQHHREGEHLGQRVTGQRHPVVRPSGLPAVRRRLHRDTARHPVGDEQELAGVQDLGTPLTETVLGAGRLVGQLEGETTHRAAAVARTRVPRQQPIAVLQQGAGTGEPVGTAGATVQVHVGGGLGGRTGSHRDPLRAMRALAKRTPSRQSSMARVSTRSAAGPGSDTPDRRGFRPPRARVRPGPTAATARRRTVPAATRSPRSGRRRSPLRSARTPSRPGRRCRAGTTSG